VLILLHGSNSFASHQKLNALIAQFKKQRDPNGDNVVLLAGENLTLDELNSKIAAKSLLAQKRLIVVHDLFSNRAEALFTDLLTYLQSVADTNDNVLIFYEGVEMDATGFGAKKLTSARQKLFGYLAAQTYSEKFPRLTTAQTAAWVAKAASAHNVSIAPPQAQLVARLAGNNLWTVHHETQKLIHFAKGKKQTAITNDDIQLLVRQDSDDNIFNLTDAIGSNNLALFFSLLDGQMEAGVSLPYILTMLTRQFKIILQIKELLVWQKNQKDIAVLLKLHPFVVQKTILQTRNFTLGYLKNTLAKLIEIDYHTKTGQASGLTGLSVLFVSPVK